MSNGPVDPDWSRLLSHSAHELRSPIGVVTGYLGMLLNESAGPLSERQRGFLREAQKSCHRLKALSDELSDLSKLEAGTATFNRSRIDLRKVLADTVASLPEVPDGKVIVQLATGDGAATIEGDPVRLKSAFTSLVNALRREMVTSTTLQVHEQTRRTDGRLESWIIFGPPDRLATLEKGGPEVFAPFNEWRGGCGLSLPIARRVIERHGGRLWSPPPDPAPGEMQAQERPSKTAALAILPLA